MPQKSLNISIILITALITAIIAVAGTMYFMQQPVTESDTSDWLTYNSEKGFSFKYPPGNEVNESIDSENPDTTIVFISSTESGNMFPALQINVSPYMVSFSLWEGLEWEGYPKIIETFRQ